MLAHELFAALSYAGFTKWEWAVIREVLAQSYGPKRTKTATVSPSDLAGRLGTFKESVVRACRTLVASGVLARVGTSEYRFVKDYEAWRAGENPRLSTTEIEDCRRTKTRNASKSTGNNGAPEAGTDALPHQQSPGTTALPAGTDALPNGNRCAPVSASPPMYPLLREEKKEREKNVNSRSLSEQTTGRTGDEHTLFVQVVRELESTEATEYLAGALVMAADSPGVRSLESWRLFVAARTCQRPDKGKTWGFFAHVAGTCTHADYLKLRATRAPGQPARVERQPFRAPAAWREAQEARKAR